MIVNIDVIARAVFEKAFSLSVKLGYELFDLDISHIASVGLLGFIIGVVSISTTNMCSSNLYMRFYLKNNLITDVKGLL